MNEDELLSQYNTVLFVLDAAKKDVPDKLSEKNYSLAISACVWCNQWDTVSKLMTELRNSKKMNMFVNVHCNPGARNIRKPMNKNAVFTSLQGLNSHRSKCNKINCKQLFV